LRLFPTVAFLSDRCVSFIVGGGLPASFTFRGSADRSLSQTTLKVIILVSMRVNRLQLYGSVAIAVAVTAHLGLAIRQKYFSASAQAVAKANLGRTGAFQAKKAKPESLSDPHS
jgi:hypothetical protein